MRHRFRSGLRRRSCKSAAITFVHLLIAGFIIIPAERARTFKSIPGGSLFLPALAELTNLLEEQADFGILERQKNKLVST